MMSSETFLHVTIFCMMVEYETFRDILFRKFKYVILSIMLVTLNSKVKFYQFECMYITQIMQILALLSALRIKSFIYQDLKVILDPRFT